MSIRIVLADDHSILREGLRHILEKKPGFSVVGEAQNGREVVELTRTLKPDVVIMDISMPDMNGIEATHRILEEFPKTKVLALSMHIDKRFVANMLNAGAKGYLRKDCASEELARAVETILKGQIFLGQKIVGIVAKDFAKLSQRVKSPTAVYLTSREREVLQLIAEGKPTKQIAHLMHASIKTIEKHRQSIMNKLSIHSIADLTKYAIREGLTSIEE